MTRRMNDEICNHIANAVIYTQNVLRDAYDQFVDGADLSDPVTRDRIDLYLTRFDRAWDRCRLAC